MRVRVGRSRDAFWLCRLKGGNPEPSLFTLSPFTLLAPCSPLLASCSPLSDLQPKPLQSKPLPPSLYLLPAPCSSLPSFCLFSLPFLLPLMNAASGCRLAKQNHCAVEYRRPIADVEGIGEFKLVSSLIIHHSPSAPHPSVPSPQTSELCLHPSCFPLLAPRFLLPAPSSCYRRESNPKLPIKSVCCAIGPCICPVFTGITVSQ